jgi:hypothetical protein
MLFTSSVNLFADAIVPSDLMVTNRAGAAKLDTVSIAGPRTSYTSHSVIWEEGRGGGEKLSGIEGANLVGDREEQLQVTGRHWMGDSHYESSLYRPKDNHQNEQRHRMLADVCRPGN